MLDQLPRLAAIRALPRRLSLKGRLIAATVGLLAVFMWALALLAAVVLEDQFVAVLANQQFAATRQLAAEFDGKLQDRVAGLVRAAAGLPADLSYAALQPLLAQRPLMHVVFTGGMAVIGLDGTAIADYPVAHGRRGGGFGDRDYFRQVVATGQPYIDKPIMGRALQRPVLTIAVPVLDAAGKVRAVMTGITDLTAANVLHFVADPARTGSAEYYVIALKDQLFIAATDASRAMTPTPPRGRNLMLDRMLDGFEGAGVAVSSQGIEKLYSGQRIPTANWLLMAALPTDIAFAPVRTLRNYLFVCAALLTLAAIVVVRRIAGRVLAPLDEVGAAMQRMTSGAVPLAPLPVGREDEIGRLIGNFNRLVDERRRYEAALADSEQRFRRLVEGAPDAVFVQVQGRFAYANAAALTLFGATTDAQLLDRPILERIHPDYRAAVAERIRRTNELGDRSANMEQIHLRLDGTSVDVEVSAVPCRYGRENGALVFARDIGQRKQAERERAQQALRLAEQSRRLVATQEDERRRLAAVLHDRTSPNLAALDLLLRAAAARQPPAPGKDALLLEDALALLKDTTYGIRDVCADLRPSLLDYGGLVPALENYARQFAERTGIAVHVDCSAAAARPAPEHESNLFRIAQEAMTNSAKHAGATLIGIVLGAEDGRLTLVVADDGCGFAVDTLGADGRRPGLGLLSMQERAEFAGGRCVIESRPGAGTRVTVALPGAPHDLVAV